MKRLWTIVLLTQLGGGWPDYEDLEPDSTARGSQRAAFLVRDNLWHRNDIEDEYLAAIGARALGNSDRELVFFSGSRVPPGA